MNLAEFLVVERTLMMKPKKTSTRNQDFMITYIKEIQKIHEGYISIKLIDNNSLHSLKIYHHEISLIHS